MYEQAFEGIWKSMESTLQLQQDILKGLSQQWMSGPSNLAGVSSEWSRGFHRMWIETGLELLDKNRQSLDASYRAGIEALKHLMRIPEAKNADEYKASFEGMWRKVVDNMKQQSESQIRDFEKWSDKSFEFMRQNGHH